MENMVELGSPENHLVYNVDIPTLQEMASHQVALSLWYSIFSRFKCSEDPRRLEYDNQEKDCHRLVETLNTPKLIKKLIKITLIRIGNELSEWSDELYSVTLNDINWCVWSFDGKIDRERSAIKMSSIAGELDAAHRFAIMCEYCLEDEIVKFPVDSLPTDFMEHEWTVNKKVIEYWYHYVKNQHDLTPTYAEVVMSLKIYYWMPFQYFWHRMSNDWQIRVAESIFEDIYSDNDDFVMNLRENYWLMQTSNMGKIFMTMSWQLQCHLLSKKRMGVILKLITSEDSLKSLCWIWTHYKNLITDRDFVKIVIYLIHFKVEKEEWMNWLIYVWDSLSDQFKIAAAERVKNLALKRIYCYSEPSHSAFIFLCRILSLQDIDFRSEFILKRAENFEFCIADHHSMNEVLKLCLPNKDERSNFKRMVAESPAMEKTCVELLHDSMLDRLNMMLDFYCATSDDVRKFKKKLLKSKAFDSALLMFHERDWDTLKTFINEIYPENESLASQTKKQLISSWDFNFVNVWYLIIYDITHLFEIVESEFSVEEVDALKRVWIQSFRSMLKTEDYWCKKFIRTRSFHCFLKWCVGDGDIAIPEYEGEDFVEAMFDRVYRSMNEKYPENQVFRLDVPLTLLLGLDKFLEWYLMSDEEKKKYNSRGMISYCVLGIFWFCIAYWIYSTLTCIIDKFRNV